MHSCHYDIQKFNDYVRGQRAALTARGENTNDLLVSLFRGYEACKDKYFLAYIRRIREDWMHQSLKLTPEQLMQNALQQYRIIQQLGEWGQEDEIVALRAELNKLKSEKSRQKSSNSQQSSSPAIQQDTTSSSTNQSESKKNKYPEWKREPPKRGEPNTKKVQGRTLHWCQYHKLWAAHNPSDCNLAHKKGNQRNDTKANNNNDNKPVLSQAAMQSIVYANDEE